MTERLGGGGAGGGGKMDPRGHLMGPEGLECFLGLSRNILKNNVKELIYWVILRVCFTIDYS